MSTQVTPVQINRKLHLSVLEADIGIVTELFSMSV